MTWPLRIALRALVTWGIEAAGLYLMLQYLPGVAVVDWDVAFQAVLVIGLLNALVRPAILLAVANLGAILFLLVALLLNGVLVMVAAWIVPGFEVGGLLTAFLVALGLAAVNTVFTTLVSVNDDDSFYRNVIRSLARRMAPVGDLDRPGTVMIQIDGLAEPILRRGLREGPDADAGRAAGVRLAPAGGVGVRGAVDDDQRAGGHPARHPRRRAGLLLVREEGPAAAVVGGPARPVRRPEGDLERARAARGRRREHLQPVQRRRRADDHDGGDAAGRATATSGADPHDFFGYLLDPYNLYRGIVGMLGEAAIEVYQAIRQWARDEQPRIRRLGLFTLHRGAANVILRDATTWSVIASMYRGHRVIYCDYQGYDEVGHFAGPETTDAVGTLNSIDRQIRQIVLAAREAPRQYQIVVLSDHGQTTSPVFENVYGKPLDEIVREVIKAGPTVRFSAGRAETTRYVGALLSDLARSGGIRGRGARRLLSTRRGSAMIEPVQEQIRRAADQNAEVVMTSSGSLAHIYFAQEPGALCLGADRGAVPGADRGAGGARGRGAGADPLRGPAADRVQQGGGARA